ncbi:MAG TPA: aldehyde dehydrogenase family protein [Streptosporangiaceae bacterium]|nr:aldehyde dehydrogenase family protein [Streptosporangiaceae bacterium]
MWPAPELLIGGELRAASDGSRFPIVNPATEEVIGFAPQAADPAFRALPARDHHRRGRRAPSYAWEQDLGTATPMGMATRRWIRKEPVGVVAAITPWNFPNQINLANLGPAPAAGRTVVLKPAPDTPWTGAELGLKKVFLELGGKSAALTAFSVCVHAGRGRGRGRSAAGRLRTGTAGLNGGIWYSPDVPFGGYKQSGFGREMGVAGFEEYLEIKSIVEPAETP